MNTDAPQQSMLAEVGGQVSHQDFVICKKLPVTPMLPEKLCNTGGQICW